MDSPRAAVTLAARGKVSLAAGEPDFETPAPIVEAAVDALRAGHTRYVELDGDLELRTKISERVAAIRRAACRPEHVLVTHGSMAGIAATILATIDPGDRVVIPEPTYSLYADLVRLAGGTPVPVPALEDHHLDVAAIATAARSAALVILCHPCNPTGVVYTAHELAALADALAAGNTLVLADEVYDQIVYPGVDFRSTLTIPGLADRLVYAQSFSKAYAMTGWRIGYVVAPPPLLGSIARVHRTLNGPCNSVVQRAALRAVSDDGTLVRPMRDAYLRRRELVRERLARVRGVSVRPPDGTFYAFVRYASSLPSLVVTQQLADAGVLVRAGREFGASGEHHIRLSFAAGDEHIAEALRRLADVFQAL